MQIVCPNCEAHYEVGYDSIGDAGRQVQCSNCGHTWLAMRQEEDQVLSAPQVPKSATFPAPTAAPVQESETLPRPAAVTPERKTSEADRKPIDETVLSILREEAAREAQQRLNESGGIEVQTNLGLQAPAPEKMPTRPAASHTLTHVEAFGENRHPATPETETTKSSQNSEKPLLQKTPATKKESSFWPSFFLCLGIGVVAALLYVNAPKIATVVPALAPHAQLYVEKTDLLRAYLIEWDAIARAQVTLRLHATIDWAEPVLVELWKITLEKISPIDPVLSQIQGVYQELSALLNKFFENLGNGG